MFLSSNIVCRLLRILLGDKRLVISSDCGNNKTTQNLRSVFKLQNFTQDCSHLAKNYSTMDNSSAGYSKEDTATVRQIEYVLISLQFIYFANITLSHRLYATIISTGIKWYRTDDVFKAHPLLVTWALLSVKHCTVKVLLQIF